MWCELQRLAETTIFLSWSSWSMALAHRARPQSCPCPPSQRSLHSFAWKRARILRLHSRSNESVTYRPVPWAPCSASSTPTKPPIQLSCLRNAKSQHPEAAAMDHHQQQQGPDAAAARRMATLASHLRPHPASHPQVSHRAPPVPIPLFRLV